MQLTYDEEADALYIQLLDGDHECLVKRVTPQLAVDLGPGDVVVGIELLSASKLLGDVRHLKLITRNIDVSVA